MRKTLRCCALRVAPHSKKPARADPTRRMATAVVASSAAVASAASVVRAFCTDGLFRDSFHSERGGSAAEAFDQRVAFDQCVAFDQRVAFRTLQLDTTSPSSSVPKILRVVINRAGPDGFSIEETPLPPLEQHDGSVASADRCLRDVVRTCLLDAAKDCENIFFDLGGSRYFVMLKLIDAPVLSCRTEDAATLTTCDNDA